MKDNKPRELSEKEIIRTQKANETSAQMEANGYKKTEITITLKKAMSISIIIWIIYSFIANIAFSAFNTVQSNKNTLKSYIIIIAVYFVLIAVHELLHGATWALFVKDRHSIEFGFVPQRMTPYCACSEPLSKKAYLLGGFMPCLVLGIIFTIIAVITGSKLLLTLSIFNVLGASGDLTSIMKLLSYKSSATEQLVLDHPSECGFIVFEK